jgi:hypothetical protein
MVIPAGQRVGANRAAMRRGEGRKRQDQSRGANCATRRRSESDGAFSSAPGDQQLTVVLNVIRRTPSARVGWRKNGEFMVPLKPEYTGR